LAITSMHRRRLLSNRQPRVAALVKERWREWIGRPTRDYDAADIAFLRAALEE
jgi:hypothetical protein